MSEHGTDTQDITAIANYLRIVSHPSRLAIALLLLEGPRAVSEIELALGLRQPNLSQHLGVMRDAQVLTASRRAKSVVYDVADGPPRILMQALRQCAPVRTTAAPLATPLVAQPAGTALDRKNSLNESDDGLMFAQVVQRQSTPSGPDN